MLVVARVIGLSLFALCVELAIRAVAPIPYAPRVSDAALSFGLYGLCATPAFIAVLPGKWWRCMGSLLAGAPFALLAANLAFAFGAHGAAGLLVAAAAGFCLGPLFGQVSGRVLLFTTLVLVLCFGLARLLKSPRMATETTPSILLVVLDTTAADHLSAYGYHRPTSPHLEKLAARGVLYTRAIATAPWTVPSHGSIFSGLYPSELGFNGWDFASHLEGGTLSGDLAETGRQTCAISANPFIPYYAGLSNGFQRSWGARELSEALPKAAIDHLRERGGLASRASLVTALALDWLDRLSVRKQPWFLFLNYIDPHAPYRPPVREREQFAPGIDPFSVAASTQLYNTGQLALTPQVKHAMSALYDGEVAAADAGLGELLEGLAARGYGDQNLLVVVTSDHGESLGDHGFVGHLLGMPESVLHVPLVLSGLGISPRVVSQPVQPVQLRATLRVILGLPPVPGIASALPPWGEALQLIVSEHRSPRWYVDGLGRWNRTFTTPTEWKTNWVAVERDGVKVVFDDQGQGVAYRLPEDPTESAPLPLTENTALVEAYRKRFRYAARADRSLFELSASDHERLRALGYIQ